MTSFSTEKEVIPLKKYLDLSEIGGNLVTIIDTTDFYDLTLV